MIRFDSDTDSLMFVEGALPTWRTFVYGGGAFHDGFSDFVADEHVAHSGVTVTLTGDANEIAIGGAAQDIASSLSFTVGIADDAVLPGTGAMTVPTGTTAQEPSAAQGMIRFDSDTDTLMFVEGALPTWRTFVYSGGAFHDGFSDFVAAEHLDWTGDISGSFTIHPNNYPVFTSTTPGAAPLSGGGTTNYLRADGTWAAPPGGSASNSFETQTVTDTDSGFTWSATGSAVATSGTDTLTWVSGTNVDIDVDATSKAIRISATGGGASALDDLSDVTISTPGTGQLFYKSSGDWVNTPQLILGAQAFDVKQTGGFGTNMVQSWYVGATGTTLAATFTMNAASVITLRSEANNAQFQINGRDGLGADTAHLDLRTNQASGFWNQGSQVLRIAPGTLDVFGTLGNDPAAGGTQAVEINLANSAGQTAGSLFYATSVDFTIQNEVDAGHMVLSGRTTAGVFRELARFDPDEGAVINYRADPVLETLSNGARIYRTTGTSTAVQIYDSSTTIQAQILASSTLTALDARVNGADIYLRANDAGGTLRNIFVGDPDGAATVYYDASAAIQSQINGGKVRDTTLSQDPSLLFHNSADQIRLSVGHNTAGNYAYLRGEVIGKLIRIQSYLTGPTLTDVFYGDPSAESTMFYNGTAAISSTALGIETFDTSGNTIFYSSSVAAGAGISMVGESANNRVLLELFNNAGSTRQGFLWSAPDFNKLEIRNEVNSDDFIISAKDSLSATVNLFIGNADTGVAFNGKTAGVSPPTYTETNVTTDRTYDANSTTIAELADVVGTLIADLRAIGLVN
jgi:hypothetical protein